MSIDRMKELNRKVMEGVEIESFFDKRTKENTTLTSLTLRKVSRDLLKSVAHRETLRI